MHTRNTRHPTISRGGLLVTVTVLLLVAQTALAEAVGDKAVLTAVHTWVRHVTADSRPDAAVARLDRHVVDGTVVAYIAHLEGGGYCICGADTRLLPVYLYRPVGTFDPDNPNYQFILSDIARRLARHNDANAGLKAPAQYDAILSQRATDWDDLTAERLPSSSGAQTDSNGDPTMMVLPVKSYWHQHSPYNDLCPELTPGLDDRAVVGCTATTAAQIMYYWRWPVTGNGSDSVEYNRRWRADWDYQALTTDPQLNLGSFWTNRLYWTSSSGGRLYMSGYWDGSIYWEARKRCNGGVNCDDADYHAALETLWDRMPRDPETCYANFGATTYNYGIMRDEHNDPPDAGSLEAAKLSYHAGIAVGMGYGVWSSNAGLTRDGMVDHLRYDPDAVGAGRDVNVMVEEIRWFRPVELTGDDGAVGHSWIACGYNTGVTAYQFLMNLGWGGGSTEWYSVDEIFPNNQWTTTRLAPLSVVRFVGGSFGGDGTPSAPYQDLATALSLVPDGTTLVFKAGTTHTLSGDPVVINKPLTLKGHDVTIARSGS